MKRYLKNPKAALWVAVCLVCLVALGAAVQARADELHLKDGTVIKGLIVSFDATTLKVKTNYGYAVIRRDTVASIVMSGTNSAKPMPKGPDTPAAPAATDAKNSATPSATPAPASSTPAPSSTPAISNEPAATAKAEPAKAEPVASNEPAAKPAEPVKTAENKSATTSPSKPATTAATKTGPTPTAPAATAPATITTAMNKPASIPATSNTPTVNTAPGANAPKPTPVLTPKVEVAENNSKPSIPSNSALPSSIGSTPNGAENPKPMSGTHAASTHSSSAPPPPLIGTQSTTNSEKPGSGVALTRRPSKPSSTINQNGFQVQSGSSAGYTSTVSGNVDQANPNHENLTPETAPGTAERMPTADDDGQPATPGLRVVPAQPIREYIVANTYINQTYNFKMYRPPEWGLVEAAHNVLPGSIAALGTDDEKTYLLVGAAQATGSLDLDLRSADMKLKEIMDHYRAVRDTTVTVSGFPALERHFRGAIDQKEWSGAVVVFERGQQLYIVLGMTQADTDLSLLKENIIQRVITSIDFSK